MKIPLIDHNETVQSVGTSPIDRPPEPLQPVPHSSVRGETHQQLQVACVDSSLARCLFPHRPEPAPHTGGRGRQGHPTRLYRDPGMGHRRRNDAANGPCALIGRALCGLHFQDEGAAGLKFIPTGLPGAMIGEIEPLGEESGIFPGRGAHEGFCGKVVTLPSISVNRECGGSSVSYPP